MFDLRTWDGFDALPKDQSVDLLVDTKKASESASSPRRWRFASFKMPRDASEAVRRKIAYARIAAWIDIEAKRGWMLRGMVRHIETKPANDLLRMIPLLDQDEVVVGAIFDTVPKPVRIEVPTLRRDYPGEVITLRDVVKAGLG